MARIRVLIADDHAMVRAGLRALIEAHADLEVVGEAEDGAIVLSRCQELKPDIVLMDLAMPGRGGVAATADLRLNCPETRVLVLTMHEDEVYARQALLAGADGFVLKKALATELIQAIRAVHRGKRYLPPALAGLLDAEPTPTTGHPAAALTNREREVVALIALGHTNAEIGERLHISEKTVETHRAHIVGKLGLHTRADLVRFALEHGLMKA